MYIREQTYFGFGLGLGDPVSFAGTFTGEVLGDNNTKATVTGTLTQVDNKVDGEFTIGRGMQLGFGGTCFVEPVDLEKIPISGTTDSANPLSLQTSTQVKEPTVREIAGVKVKFVVMNVRITAVLSGDGKSIRATISLTPVTTEPKIPFAVTTCKTKTLPEMVLQRVA